MFYFIVVGTIISAILVLIRVYCWLTCGKCKCSRHLVGKVVIVTGANAGIGFETAKDLAERGARVILACRSETRGTAARDHIIAVTGNNDVHFRRLDLVSLASVRAFAENILKTEKQLHILINNAGLMTNEKTEDGLLVGMQVNHFGPFLLTSLLLPLLKSSAPSRIINVSSMAHQRGEVDFDGLNFAKGTHKNFSSFQIYCNTKLCNVLMTAELDRRLKGTKVTANSLHPGAVETNFLDISNYNVFVQYAAYICKIVSKTAWEGAQTSIYLAVSPEVAELSGRYFSDCSEVKPAKAAQDPDIARKLWEISEKLVASK